MVYIANFGDGTVTSINPVTGMCGAPINVGNHPWAIAVTPDGSSAYVASPDDGVVTPISTAARAVGNPIGIGRRLTAIAISPEGSAALPATTKERSCQSN